MQIRSYIVPLAMLAIMIVLIAAAFGYDMVVVLGCPSTTKTNNSESRVAMPYFPIVNEPATIAGDAAPT